MNIEEVMEKIDKGFDIPAIMKRREKAAKQRQAEASAQPPLVPVDVYQRNQDRIRSVDQKTYPRGASRVVEIAVNGVVDGVGTEGLAKAYRRAKIDVEALKKRGEKGRAELAKRQYTIERFLPAVEIVVNASSPDEVLNSSKALSMLDKYALLDGSGDGYTASYIRQAYGNQLGRKEGSSDTEVFSGVAKINSLLDRGEVRMARGIAEKLKDKIDNGENMADDIDYNFIGRVVSFYE